MSGSSRAFVTLDGLRGIAALAVVTRHAPDFFKSISIYVPAQEPGGQPVSVGPFFESYLAVDFFFALSGFVLAYAYGERLRSGLSPARFMSIRFIRLYPLYFLGLILSAIVLQRELSHDEVKTGALLVNLLTALLFLPSPASSLVLFPLNVPAWSLFYELLANCVFALIGRHLKMALLLAVVGVAGVVLFTSVITGWVGFGSSGIGAMADGFQWQGIGAGAARVAYSFFAGILVFRVWKSWRLEINVPPLLVVTALSAILFAHPPERYQLAFDLVATLIVFPMLIFLGANSAAKGILARLFAWMGAASYAIYVLQAPLYDFAHRGLGKLTGGNLAELPAISGAAFVVFVFVVALIADRYYDVPAREFLTARLKTSATRRQARSLGT